MAFIWLVIALALCIPLIGLVIDGPIGRALASRLERPQVLSGGGEASRIAQLEEEIDTLRREIEHLRDGQEFMQSLLRDSRPDTRLPPASE